MTFKPFSLFIVMEMQDWRVSEGEVVSDDEDRYVSDDSEDEG